MSASNQIKVGDAIRHLLSTSRTDPSYERESYAEMRAFRDIHKLACEGNIRISGRAFGDAYPKLISPETLRGLQPIDICVPRSCRAPEGHVFGLGPVNPDTTREHSDGGGVYEDLLVHSQDIYEYWPMLGDHEVEEDFLNKEFEIPNVQRLPVESRVAKIIESRLNEVGVVLANRAYLSAIVLCGSVLEGVLLGAAKKDPEKFNRSPASPKRDGKVKSLREWGLADLINVACDIGVLKPDVKEFSHGLRHFRNYIHPYEQMASNFTPDEHTVKVCFQVLKAALASVAGERL